MIYYPVMMEIISQTMKNRSRQNQPRISWKLSVFFVVHITLCEIFREEPRNKFEAPRKEYFALITRLAVCLGKSKYILSHFYTSGNTGTTVKNLMLNQ